MKKLLLSLLLLATVTLSSVAQCTPNPIYTGNGNWPKVLKTAWVDSSYSMVVTNVVPLDTQVTVSGAPIDVVVDSVVIINIQGIPAGYSSACNPSNCHYYGGTTGCFVITGTTSNVSLVGNHPLEIFTKTYAHILVLGFPIAQAPQSDTVKSYTLEIKKALPIGVFTLSAAIKELAVYPNPTEGLITLHTFLQEANKIDVKIYNLLGEVILNENIVASNKDLTHSMNLSGSKPGIYFVEVKTSKETFIRKILLQ